MIAYTIELYADAQQDLRNAYTYYKSISPLLAAQFIHNFDTAVNRLSINPFYQIKYDSFRVKMIYKFPYCIHFVVEESLLTVKIYGIRHTAQNPDTSYIKEVK